MSAITACHQRVSIVAWAWKFWNLCKCLPFNPQGSSDASCITWEAISCNKLGGNCRVFCPWQLSSMHLLSSPSSPWFSSVTCWSTSLPRPTPPPPPNFDSSSWLLLLLGFTGNINALGGAPKPPVDGVEGGLPAKSDPETKKTHNLVDKFRQVFPVSQYFFRHLAQREF